MQEEIDLFIVTPDQRRKFEYEKLLRRSRAIHKLGLGSLAPRIRPYCVRPPVPTIIETIWPSADKYDESADLIEALHSKEDQVMYESLVALQKIRDPSAAPGIGVQDAC